MSVDTKTLASIAEADGNASGDLRRTAQIEVATNAELLAASEKLMTRNQRVYEELAK